MATETTLTAKGPARGDARPPKENAQAGSEGITADQLAHQLAQLRGKPENDLDGAESADTEADAGGESEAALNAEATSVAATASDDAEVDGESVEGTDGEQEQEQEQEGGAEEDGDLPAETQERINKRIGKEVARRKTLEEENAQLKAQLAEKNGKTQQEGTERTELTAEAATAAANATGFGGSRFEQQVQSELAQAESLMEWAQNNPGGGTVRGSDGKEYSFNAEQAGAIQRKAIKDVTRLTVKLENFQQEKGRNDQVLTQAAVAEYPKMFQKGSAENKLALKLLGDFPELLQLPGGKLALGDIVSATMGRISKAKANGSQNGNGARGDARPPTGEGAKRPSPRPTKIPTGNGSAPGNRTGAASTRRTGVVDADANTVEGLAKSFAKRRAA